MEEYCVVLKGAGMAFHAYTSYSGRINIVGGEGKFLRCAGWITIEARVGMRYGAEEILVERNRMFSPPG